MAKKHIKSSPGLFGMIYYYNENGKLIGKSRPGLIKGTRVYTAPNGRYVGKSRPGFLAKEVYTESNGDCITSYGTLLGDIHVKNGTPIGRSTPDLFGSSYTSLKTEDNICEDEANYVEDDFPEESYDENEYENRKKFSFQTPLSDVGKKLNLLVLFIVICAVIICISVTIKR